MRDAGSDALITKGDSMGDRFIPLCRSAITFPCSASVRQFALRSR